MKNVRRGLEKTLRVMEMSEMDSVRGWIRAY
jgi:hypothetical protein